MSLSSLTGRVLHSLRAAHRSILPPPPSLFPQLALAGLAPPAPGGSAGGLIGELREALSGLWLMAVPKKRVSRARRAVRQAPKFLRWDYSIKVCAKCGLPRRPHTYCDKFNCGRPDEAEAGLEAAPTADKPEVTVSEPKQ